MCSLASPSPPRATRLERDLFAWTLLAAILLWAAMALPFWLGKVYTSDDLWAFHIPLRAFYAQCLARGEDFDWLPHLFAGFYLTGEGQVGTYHPLHLALYRWLPLRAALDLELLLSYPAMLAGMYLFLRRIVTRRDAALVGGLVFTFGGFNLLHFMHVNAIAVVAHIPWLLWAIDVCLRVSDRRQASLAAAAVALLTGSQILLGYPQYVWFSLLAEAAWIVWASWRQWPAARLVRLALAKSLGVLIGAVQLLPTLDALAGSQRQAAGADFVNAGALHPANVLQWFAPYLLKTRVVGENTHELGLYAGVVPLLLIIWLLSRRADWDASRRIIAVALGFGCVALLLAFGRYGGLYQIQTWLPLVNSFRMPARYIVLVHLAMGVLTAVAFAELVRHAEEQSPLAWGRLRFLGSAVAGSLALACIVPFVWPVDLLASWALLAAGPVLMAAAAAVLALAARGSRAALVGLVLLTAVDLGVYGMSYAVWPNAVPLEEFMAGTLAPPDRSGRAVAELPANEPALVRVGNWPILADTRLLDGYVGLTPRNRLDYLGPSHAPLAALRTAGVAWVLRGEMATRLNGLTPHDEQWLAVPDPLPRVRLVTRAVMSVQPAHDIATIPLESTALVDDPLELPGGTPGTASLVAERPGELHLVAECSTRQLLVLAERYHAGWRAAVNGLVLPVHRVNGDFMGVLLDPGQHEILLSFQPASLRWGRLLSLAGLVLTGLFCAGCVPSLRKPGGRESFRDGPSGILSDNRLTADPKRLPTP